MVNPTCRGEGEGEGVRGGVMGVRGRQRGVRGGSEGLEGCQQGITQSTNKG